jgi:biopolymer transport protein ExbB
MEKITLLEYFNKGGWAMWPLIIFSIATISIILERIIYFLSHKLSVKNTKKKIIEGIKVNNIGEAQNYLESCGKKNLGAKIMLSGLNMASLGEHRMEKAIETEASEKIFQLERGFNFLIAIGSLAPLTGFLGTVSGMISAFKAIASADEVSAQLVAKGIFEALITTAYGLIIAIVAVAGYNIFSHIVDKFSADIEELGSDMITAVLKKGK